MCSVCVCRAPHTFRNDPISQKSEKIRRTKRHKYNDNNWNGRRLNGRNNKMSTAAAAHAPPNRIIINAHNEGFLVNTTIIAPGDSWISGGEHARMRVMRNSALNARRAHNNNNIYL